MGCYAENFISEEDLNNSGKFCKNSATTTAFLMHDSIKEITLKVGKMESKSYEFKYLFLVDANNFSAKRTINLTTSKDSLQIWYDKNDPNTNSFENPCVNFEKIKKEKNISVKWPFYTIGGLMLLFGIVLTWGTFKELLRDLFSSKPRT